MKTKISEINTSFWFKHKIEDGQKIKKSYHRCVRKTHRPYIFKKYIFIFQYYQKQKKYWCFHKAHRATLKSFSSICLASESKVPGLWMQKDSSAGYAIKSSHVPADNDINSVFSLQVVAKKWHSKVIWGQWCQISLSKFLTFLIDKTGM